jgi:DNA-binding response OmpR family regulator
VRTLLRRAPAPPRQRLVAGDLALDRDARTVEWRGSHLALTGREFALLEYLLLHPNATLSRQQIAEHVWDSDYEARSNTIDVIVARVRRKLERAGAPRLVHAVPGVGYALRPGGGAPR